MRSDRTSASAARRLLGQEGESLARAYLLAAGYEILDANWRSRHWELDLVACKDGICHFIEVKTSRAEDPPLESISQGQMIRITRAATSWLAQRDLESPFQFDLIAISFRQEGSYTLEHVEEAFFSGF